MVAVNDLPQSKKPVADTVVLDALRQQLPVKDLAGVSIRNIQKEPRQPFDVSFELRSGSNRVQVLGEIKPTFSSRLLEEVAPWIQRLKALRNDVAVAIIVPIMPASAQRFCIQNAIDFLDLAGNISINVPGKFYLQRTGMRGSGDMLTRTTPRAAINVFSGRYSRVLRVILEKPGNWSITGIAKELEAESARFKQSAPAAQIAFQISLGSVSKAVASLEEQLLVRRRDASILTPEPARVLLQWAEKYRERYRWRLRSSFQTANSFGRDLQAISEGIQRTNPGIYAFTGAAAASIAAPYVDVDLIDLFTPQANNQAEVRNVKTQPAVGPSLRFIYPYDEGVFMYAKRVAKALVVSDVQTYLDLYARGGRDLKAAEVLLDSRLKPRWSAA